MTKYERLNTIDQRLKTGGKKIKDANWQNKTLQIRKSTGGRALRGYGRAFLKGGKV